jgi:hypothetical protein
VKKRKKWLKQLCIYIVSWMRICTNLYSDDTLWCDVNSNEQSVSHK